MTYSIDEIKKLRAAITPGEWELWTGCSWRRFGVKGNSDPFIAPYVASDGHPNLSFRNSNDAEFIAASPAIVDQLLPLAEENEKLKATIAELQIQHSKGHYTPLHEAERQRLNAENERLKAELESAERVGAKLVARDHQPCKEMLFASQLRAQAAEDVAQKYHHYYYNSDGGMITGNDSRQSVKDEIEKRIAELKGERK